MIFNNWILSEGKVISRGEVLFLVTRGMNSWHLTDIAGKVISRGFKFLSTTQFGDELSMPQRLDPWSR